MDSSKTERHNAPYRTDDGTRVAYAEAATGSRKATEALEQALRDPDLRPSALLGPEATRNGVTRRRPWSARGVTAPRARRVLAYASAQYLGGYSKVEAGTRWTRSSGQAPHLPLIRQTCHALGLDGSKQSNRTTVGAVYGYLDALGVLAYEPGRGPRYAYLAYGPVALAGRSLAQPPHRVSGGIPQQWGTPSTTAVGYSSRGSIREEKTLPAVSRREPVAANGKRESSNNEKQEQRLTRSGSAFLDALVGEVSAYGAHYGKRLEAEGYRQHAALLSQARKWGALVERSGVKSRAHSRAVSRLHLGEANLDAAERLPSLLAHLLGKHYAEAEAYLARHQEAEAEQRAKTDAIYAAHAETGVEVHGGEEPVAFRGGAEPAAIGAALAHLAHLAPETAGVDPRTTVEAYAIASGSAVAEMRPAYETEEPLRARLIGDAVRLGQTLGYGVPERVAVAVHAGYLDLRQAGTLDPEQDLPEIEAALGRPLHLAEVALYGVTLRVSAAEWERAETSTYTGGAAYPEPVEVRGVSLAGTAVAP